MPASCLSLSCYTRSAIIVPVVLFLSVLMFQLTLYALRHPFLRLMGHLYTSSSIVRKNVSYLESVVSTISLGTASVHTRLPTAASGPTPQGPSTQEGADGDVENPPSIWRALADNAVATVMAVLMFVYLPIARVAFSMLLCVKVAGSDRWVVDVRLQCPAAAPYTSWGAGALLLGSFLLIVCIAWPVGIAWVLIRKAHRGELLRVAPRYKTASPAGSEVSTNSPTLVVTTAKLVVRYGDYAVDYDALQSFYAKAAGLSGWQYFCRLGGQSVMYFRVYLVLVWDSVLDLQRFTIALVSLCVMLHEAHQLTLMIMVLGAYLLAVLLVRPWRARAVWQLQVAALAVLIASCIGILATTVQNASSYYSSHVIRKYTGLIPWLVVAVNVVYLVTLLVMWGRCVRQEVPNSTLWSWVQQNKGRADRAANERAMQELIDARGLGSQA
jgi:hypothetical protein